MKLTVYRKWFSEISTIGEFCIDDAFFCFCLEDRIRAPGVKVKGQTAIPPGHYEVVIDLSARFGRAMPHVLSVPGFEGIRIHSGNTASDTEGCLLLGTERGIDRVLHSRIAFDQFYKLLAHASEEKETITIDYVNVSPPTNLVV